MTGIITNEGKKVILNRAYSVVPDYTAPSKFKIGISQTTPVVTDTNLDVAVPIADGTVNDDGDNQLTGSSGGTNSTDNTTTFKPGAGVTDNTAQNLIANDTNVLKIWTIADLSANGTNVEKDEFFGLWLYIKDATALAKFEDAGTVLEVKLGKDTSNYFSLTKEKSDLAVGWNWITSNTVLVEDLTETGTVDAALDTFVIEITTNNATDEFAAGDVIYDLLRTWEAADLTNTFPSGYPTFNESTLEVTMRGTLLSTEGNGFSLNTVGIFNTDATNKLTDLDDHTADGKVNTDEFVYIWKNRIT